MNTALRIDAAWAQWCAGDEVAGERLFRDLRTVLLSYFRRRRPEQAEDLTHRTLVACVRARGRFRGDARVMTYALAIARRMLSNQGKRKRVETLMVRDATDPDAQLASSTGGMESRLTVRAAVRSLPPCYRDVLEQYYVVGYRASAVARRLRIPEGTVRSRLRRGRTMLREVLAAEGSPWSLEPSAGALPS